MDDQNVEPIPFHRGNFRLNGSEEENKLVNKLFTQYILLAAVPVTMVNFTAKALFKTVLKNPRNQQIWNIGAMVQAVLVTSFVFSRITKRVSSEFPQGFMAQMRYLRNHPEAMQEFKTFRKNVKSGRLDYITESLINTPISGLDSDPNNTRDGSEKSEQTSTNFSNANTNKTDMRYKLYRASLQAEPVPIMERHTCFKARAALHEKQDQAASSPKSSLYNNPQYLVLYDSPQTRVPDTTGSPLSYSRLKHEVEINKAVKHEESSEEEKSAIKPQVGSYKRWRQATDSSKDPLPTAEMSTTTSSSRLTGSWLPPAGQTEPHDTENQSMSSQSHDDKKKSGSKHKQNIETETQQNKPKRRNIYGDIIEPDVRWKNR